MNKLLTDRVKLIRALQSCTKGNCRLLCGDYYGVRNAVDRIRADHSSFLSLSQDKDGRVSYSTKPGKKLDGKGRVRTSLGRYFRRQLKMGCSTISDRGLAWIQAQVFATTADISGSITVVRGKDIQRAYDDRFGGGTCMTGEYSKYTKLYADNPDVVAMIKYENTMQARALLWTTDDGVTVLDRIYPDDCGAHIVAIRLWAEKRGYIVRGCNSLPKGNSIPLSDESRRQVTLRDNGVYPFLDTFCFGVVDRGRVRLCNVKKKGDHAFWGTNGEWLTELTCYECGRSVGEEDVCSHQDEHYCEECFDENFTLCDNCNDYCRSGSVITCVEDDLCYCEQCTSEELFYCNGCANWYKTKWVAVDTGNEYCGDCASNTLTPCEECGELYEKPMEESRGCLYCPDCTANRKQENLFKTQRRSKKAAVAC